MIDIIESLQFPLILRRDMRRALPNHEKLVPHPGSARKATTSKIADEPQSLHPKPSPRPSKQPSQPNEFPPSAILSTAMFSRQALRTARAAAPVRVPAMRAMPARSFAAAANADVKPPVAVFGLDGTYATALVRTCPPPCILSARVSIGRVNWRRNRNGQLGCA